VLDPGPEDAAHLAAILAATRGETVGHILVSHTHRDHSPGAAALAAATGAPTVGHGPHLTPPGEGGEGGDHAFRPHIRLADGDALEGEGWRLSALHTPGHCGNHLCFALEGTGTLFSADHVMSWSTSVVSPPDGDMAAYMQGLARLRGREDRLLRPATAPPSPTRNPSWPRSPRTGKSGKRGWRKRWRRSGAPRRRRSWCRPSTARSTPAWSPRPGAAWSPTSSNWKRKARRSAKARSGCPPSP